MSNHEIRHAPQSLKDPHASDTRSRAGATTGPRMPCPLIAATSKSGCRGTGPLRRSGP